MTPGVVPLRPPARMLDARFIRSPLTDGRRTGPALDATDRELIRMLQHDGRRSFARMARDLGVTEKTVRRHVERLRDSGLINIAIVADPRLLGYGSSALLGLTLERGAGAADVVADLAALDAVDYVVTSNGRFQILAELLCRDATELTSTIEQRVRTAPGIATCETFPYLRLYYQQPEWDAAHARAQSGLRPGTVLELDDVDRRILVELSADGRVALGAVSDVVGVSESVVRQRVNRMLASGAVKVMALTNPLSLGFGMLAWLGIVAGPGARLGPLADELAQHGPVAYAAICGGRFNVLAEVICGDEEELLSIVDEEISEVPGIARIEVSVCGDLHYKRLQPRFEP
jgi:Lrp/AsnC family transcriptional regulator for asnA, asnC and gidA